jgi:hypothetical protein
VPRYEVEFRRGSTLVDAISPADARKTARSVFGKQDGPYKAILVPPGTTTVGDEVSAKVHKSDKFWARERRKETREAPAT